MARNATLLNDCKRLKYNYCFIVWSNGNWYFDTDGYPGGLEWGGGEEIAKTFCFVVNCIWSGYFSGKTLMNFNKNMSHTIVCNFSPFTRLWVRVLTFRLYVAWFAQMKLIFDQKVNKSKINSRNFQDFFVPILL